jgi:threonine dehydrogenase-like Zn-dependent dehydrogenase
VRAGRIRPSQVFTHSVPLEDAPRAYRTFAQKSHGCIKVALFPDRTTVH